MKPFRLLPFLATAGLLFLAACTEPVEPVFQFETGFLLVDGRITDTPGYSEVTVARNEIVFGDYQLQPVAGVAVSSVSTDGEETAWELIDAATGRFAAPEGWVARRGQEYSIRVTTPAGEIVESAPEPVPVNVPIQDARVDFEQEAFFNNNLDRFVPAFFLRVDVDDPADEQNFYQWNYTTFQTIEICATCERSRWRDGRCIAGPDTRFVSRWDYLCDARCWISSRGQNVNILRDEFSNGQTITDIEAGRVTYERPGRLLFDLQQYNISAAAFRYARTLRDLSEGAGGLNAPLPAALVGNLTDVGATETPVLGFVGVSSVSNERIMILRDTFDGMSLPYDGSIIPEPVMPAPPVAPCVGGTRSRIQPEGWVD